MAMVCLLFDGGDEDGRDCLSCACRNSQIFFKFEARAAKKSKLVAVRHSSGIARIASDRVASGNLFFSVAPVVKLVMTRLRDLPVTNLSHRLCCSLSKFERKPFNHLFAGNVWQESINHRVVTKDHDLILERDERQEKKVMDLNLWRSCPAPTNL